MDDSFSKRYGYHNPKNTEISIREDASDDLREYLLRITYECGFQPEDLLTLILIVLKESDSYSDYAQQRNYKVEIEELINSDKCKWYSIYDIIESIAQKDFGDEWPRPFDKEKFKKYLNDYFLEKGIGWKLVNGIIEFRGPESFEEIKHTAELQLEAKGLSTTQRELHYAIQDISRRPSPDITGAIQHSMAAAECVARKISGDEKATLGQIIKKHEDLFPKPLNKAISEVWGYASDNARHIKEGSKPTLEEAELVVGLSCVIITYLSSKLES